MASARPFQFTSLPRLTKQQAALQESLALYLSVRPLQPDFNKEFTATLSDLVKQPCVVSAPELRSVSRSELGAMLPALACLAVVGAAPTEHKIVVELDMALAAATIERLLGGSGEAVRMQRAFTDIEYGVLSYPLLRLLQLFAQDFASGRELSLSLDKFASTLDELDAVTTQESGYQMLGYRLQVGKRNGYARVLLPDALVTKRFGAPISQSGATEQELNYMRQRLMALGSREVTARLQVTHVDLQPKDIANVEAGDIIILENHHIRVTADGIEGDIFVTLGNGKNGGFNARLRNDESEAEQARLEILDIVVQEQPLEDAMPEDPSAPDNLPQTEGLLRDVDAPVVVELGRIRMNTAQVVRLRTGQILRLTRGPNDPVDLVVNGKLFARGELIEVEGELGVRLTQVAGQS
jgi:type III secretion system YscQ/HrcQ family protein